MRNLKDSETLNTADSEHQLQGGRAVQPSCTMITSWSLLCSAGEHLQVIQMLGWLLYCIFSREEPDERCTYSLCCAHWGSLSLCYWTINQLIYTYYCSRRICLQVICLLPREEGGVWLSYFFWGRRKSLLQPTSPVHPSVPFLVRVFHAPESTSVLLHAPFLNKLK